MNSSVFRGGKLFSMAARGATIIGTIITVRPVCVCRLGSPSEIGHLLHPSCLAAGITAPTAAKHRPNVLSDLFGAAVALGFQLAPNTPNRLRA